MGSGAGQGGAGGSQMGAQMGSGYGMPGGGITSMMGGMSPGMGGGMFGGQQSRPTMGTYFGGQGPQRGGQFGNPYMGGQFGNPYMGGGQFGGMGGGQFGGGMGATMTGYPGQMGGGFGPNVNNYGGGMGSTSPSNYGNTTQPAIPLPHQQSVAQRQLDGQGGGGMMQPTNPYMIGGQQAPQTSNPNDSLGALARGFGMNMLQSGGPMRPGVEYNMGMGGGQFGGGMGQQGLANIFQQFQQGQNGYGQKAGGVQNKPGHEAFRAMMGIM